MVPVSDFDAVFEAKGTKPLASKKRKVPPLIKRLCLPADCPHVASGLVPQTLTTCLSARTSPTQEHESSSWSS